MFSKKYKWTKKIAFFSIFLLFASLIWVGFSISNSNSVDKTAKAAFNSNLSRFENTLDSENNITKYSYVFENTSPDTAIGYFELKLQAILSQINIDQVVEVTSIKQTFPVNSTTGEPVNNSPTIINENIADASFIKDGLLNVKISPGTECVPMPSGGCETKPIPASVPMRLDVELKLKPNVTYKYLLDGQGKVFFPNGYDTNSIGWRITVNPNAELPPNLSVTITQLSFIGTDLNVSFNTNNYTNSADGMHTHFYFDTEPNTSLNKMYKAASPYLIPEAMIPLNATQICAIVANPDHSIISDSGSCLNLASATGNPGGESNNFDTFPSPNSTVVAGVPLDFIFTLRNNSNTVSDIYSTIGLNETIWMDAKNSLLRPTPLCSITIQNGLASTGSCNELFNGGGFGVINMPPNSSTQVKVSEIVFLSAPIDIENEIKFKIFSSNINNFGPNSTPNFETITYDSKYGKNLEIYQEKVTNAYAFGGGEAFNQIQEPYKDLIYAVTIKNTAQVQYQGIGLDAGLGTNSGDFYDGCSFSQVQNIPLAQPGEVVINVVNNNLQGSIYTSPNLNHQLTNISIPASNGFEPSKSIFYVGCRRNSNPIPNNVRLFALTNITNFDFSLDSVFNLIGEGGIKSKLEITNGNNLKIEKSLLSKSTPKIQSGTEAEYEIKVMNTGNSVAEDFLIGDIIQIPSGVLINVETQDIVNPFQDGSTTNRVVSTQDLASAFPTLNTNLANTSRVFRVSNLKGNDFFSLKYKVVFSGSFPGSCTVSSLNDSFPVIRNIAFIANINSGVANGDSVSGTTNNLSLGNIFEFLKFNTNLEDNSLTLKSGVLFDDVDISDNLAIVDSTSGICDIPNIDPQITGTTLTTNEIANLNVICLPVLAGAKSICSFKLPTQIALPNDFKLGVANEVMSSCERLDFNPEDQTRTNEILSNVVICKEVQSPSTSQSLLLYAQIGNEPRTLTGEKLSLISNLNLPLVLIPSETEVEFSWAPENGQFVAGIPEINISLNEGDNLTNFEPASILVTDFRKIAATNLIPCTSYKLKFNLLDIAGNIISSNIKEFKTTGCVDNRAVLAQKTVPINNTSGGKLKLVVGSGTLDLDIPAGFSDGDKKIQAQKLDQTGSQINGLPKLPESRRLAKNKTFDLKAFDNTNSITTIFERPIQIKMSYTDQDVNLLDPNTLTIKSWDGSQWKDLTNCSRDTVNKIVMCDTTHFSIFSLVGQTALDTSDLSWVFSPKSGTTAPLFKDSSPITATVKNFSTSRNNTPSTGQYTCKFEFKPIRANITTYTQISTGIPYDPVSGCSGNLTKALRANNLNIEFRVTLTNTLNPAQNYTSTHKYFMLFRGSGVAFGN